MLNNHVSIVELLSRTLSQDVKLDAVRDSWYRTALHYAFASESGTDAGAVLQEYGASDLTMDAVSTSAIYYSENWAE